MTTNRIYNLAGKSEAISNIVLEIKKELLSRSNKTNLVGDAIDKCTEIWEANNKLLRLLGYHAEDESR